MNTTIEIEKYYMVNGDKFKDVESAEAYAEDLKCVKWQPVCVRSYTVNKKTFDCKYEALEYAESLT